MNNFLPLARSTLACVATALFVGATACDRTPRSEPESGSESGAPVASGTADPTAHAPVDVVPGSWEDWCGEHEVPETLCTRCHPELAAAFQATGDWCADHGLPRSQCRACDPNLVIQRPPRPGATP